MNIIDLKEVTNKRLLEKIIAEDLMRKIKDKENEFILLCGKDTGYDDFFFNDFFYNIYQKYNISISYLKVDNGLTELYYNKEKVDWEMDLDEYGDTNFDDIYEKCKNRCKKNKDIKVIFIENIESINQLSKFGINEKIYRLKKMAKKLGVCLVCTTEGERKLILEE